MDHAKSALPSLKNSENKYDVLYVNTPWSVMNVERMGNLPLKDISAENAALFIWTDAYTVPKTCQLLDKWGFKFHSVFQVMDIAQHPWMKNNKISAKTDEMEADKNAGMNKDMTPDTKENSESPESPEIKENSESPETKDTPKKKTVKKPAKKTRAPPVTPPSWWTSAPENLVAPSRPTTEQLWLAVKGDASSIFGNSTVAYNVMNLPELGKKSRSKKTQGQDKWDLDRPTCFLDTVVQHMTPGTKILDLFSTILHDKVDSWGPGLPGGFLKGYANKNGLPEKLNQVMRTMKKSQLQSLSQKIPKLLAAAQPDRNTIMSEFQDSWAPVANTMNTLKLPQSYSWKKDDGEVEDWAFTLVQMLAQKNVAEFSSIRKKRKKRQSTQKPGTRPRHGIACPSKVSKELAEFLKMDPDELIARTAVVKKLNDYIKENSLKNPDRQVEILLDEPLKKLLAPPEGFGKVTYFNLCRLVGAHFPKKTDEEKKADRKARDEENKRKKKASLVEEEEKMKKAKV